MEQLNILKKRLSKIGIDVEYLRNYPWVYLWRVNGKRVKEKFESKYGFTIGFLPIIKDRPFHFTNLERIFKVIRKYNRKII